MVSKGFFRNPSSGSEKMLDNYIISLQFFFSENKPRNAMKQLKRVKTDACVTKSKHDSTSVCFPNSMELAWVWSQMA